MTHAHLIELDEVDSTNRFLHDYQGDEPLVVVTAQHQTDGRGQGGNHWEDSRGQNLLFSIRVQPTQVPIDHQFVIAMADALALHQALSHYADGFALKWPNDIYWHDRKLSGTLIETAINHGRMARMILGTGINVNQQRFLSDAPNPVSLSQITGRKENVDQLLQRVLQAFETCYRRVLEADYEGIAAHYHAALYRCEGLYPYRDAQGEFMARIEHVGFDGRLHLRDIHGKPRCYAFKEVEFILENKS